MYKRQREDRAFATRLVLGVVSARGTLDEIIDRSLRSPDDVQDDVRDALRIGVYEMYFLDKSPHAAVDQCVELVRTFAPKACGLANAVLRKASSLKGEFPFGNPQADLEAFARQYAFPVWLSLIHISPPSLSLGTTGNEVGRMHAKEDLTEESA